MKCNEHYSLFIGTIDKMELDYVMSYEILLFHKILNNFT